MFRKYKLIDIVNNFRDTEMVTIPVSDNKDVESGSTPKDENGISVKDDLNFSWDDLPDKFMREEYELRMPSSTVPVSEDTKVMNLHNLNVAIF